MKFNPLVVLSTIFLTMENFLHMELYFLAQVFFGHLSLCNCSVSIVRYGHIPCRRYGIETRSNRSFPYAIDIDILLTPLDVLRASGM